MNDRRNWSLLPRTRMRLARLWHELSSPLRDRNSGRFDADLPDEDAERLRDQIEACIVERGGEVTGRARAADLGRTYLDLSPTGRERFLTILAEGFAADGGDVGAAITDWHETDGEAARQGAEARLRQALEPPRRHMLRQFNILPEGLKFLVNMRADVRRLARSDSAFAGLDGDLRDLLASWFDVGFLELRRISWDEPASLLEKLIAYEAVHEIRSWDDLKNRLDSDRSCYAFFHPRMPDEPLIFVEVALVTGLAGNIQDLLDEAAPAADPETADTAIFYSISSAQAGLAGVSFGDFLIKRVVDDLKARLPNLTTFATLSPIPGFRKWLDPRLAEGGEGLLTDSEIQGLERATGRIDGATALRNVLTQDGWLDDETLAAAVQAPLMRLCARYLLEERRVGTSDGRSGAKGETAASEGAALDRVAHFHLTNGARVESLNWAADSSAKGLRQSAGLMVNYLYDLAEIEPNHERYMRAREVAAAAPVRNLLKT